MSVFSSEIPKVSPIPNCLHPIFPLPEIQRNERENIFLGDFLLALPSSVALPWPRSGPAVSLFP